MGAQALPSVAHPGLTEITYGPLIVTNTTALATKPHVHNQRFSVLLARAHVFSVSSSIKMQASAQYNGKQLF